MVAHDIHRGSAHLSFMKVRSGSLENFLFFILLFSHMDLGSPPEDTKMKRWQRKAGEHWILTQAPVRRCLEELVPDLVDESLDLIIHGFFFFFFLLRLFKLAQTIWVVRFLKVEWS